MKKYKTEEERKTARRERQKLYYQKNKKKVLEQQAKYRQDNKEKIAEYQSKYQAEYRSTPYGRALHLNRDYKRNDKKYNRGKCTLTAQWIVDNIFSQPCHYCGETDWHKLGCDRIDNTKPHTPSNVVPCCCECNTKKQKTPYDEYMRLIGNNNGGEL